MPYAGFLVTHGAPRRQRPAGGVLPGMIARRSGKIVVMGSATALRGLRRASTYSAARGAQLAWVFAVFLTSSETSLLAGQGVALPGSWAM